MSTSVDTPSSITVRNGCITIVMISGQQFTFSASDCPRLADADDYQLQHVTLSPYGVHWPLLDEDLSMEGIKRGDFGPDTRTG
jgi:hypothetical protein